LGAFDGFEGLNDRICVDCNGSIGRGLETHFCRGGQVDLFRKFYGIEGRSHHDPSKPFQRGPGGYVPIRIQGKVPGTDIDAFWEITQGQLRIRAMSQLIVRDKAGSHRCVPITESMLDDPALLKEELSRIDADTDQEIRCATGPDQDEVHRLTALLCQVFPNKRTNWQTIRCPSNGVTVVADLRSPALPFARAVAKIGFHYFLKQFPRYRGSEPQFTTIREFITTGTNVRTPDEIPRLVRVAVVPQHLIRNMELSKESCGHLLVAGMNELQFYAWAEFFKGFGGPEFACIVELGSNPSGLIYEERHAHRFTWYRHGPRGGYDGEMEVVDAVMCLRPPFE